jgi:Zn-dependent protease
MKGSYKLLTLAGIDIRLHFTFPLILIWGAFQWAVPHGGQGAIFGALLMAALFTCVALHELGHAVTARRLGLPVREIVLLPIGGVAFLGRNPRRPVDELLIAAAGPAVNVVIAGILLAGMVATGTFLPALEEFGKAGPGAPSLPTALFWLLGSNVMLVLFNLVPAFPMDGGRMLRALLAMVIGYARATRVAAGVGQVLAAGFGAWALFQGNFMLALVAVFVFLGASAERAGEQARGLLSTLRLRDAYNKHALVLAPADPVHRVVDYLLTSYQPDFAVIHGGQMLGIVTRQAALQAVVENGDAYVAGVMARDFLRLDAGLSLYQAQVALTDAGATVAAVFDGERYLGLINGDDLREALQIAAYLQAAEARHGRHAGEAA